MSSGLRVKLTFPEDLVTQPVIGRLARQFDVMPNIRWASIEDRIGWMVCELEGAPGVVDAAVAWLRDVGVQVDLLEDVVEG